MQRELFENDPRCTNVANKCSEETFNYIVSDFLSLATCPRNDGRTRLCNHRLTISSNWTGLSGYSLTPTVYELILDSREESAFTRNYECSSAELYRAKRRERRYRNDRSCV